MPSRRGCLISSIYLSIYQSIYRAPIGHGHIGHWHIGTLCKVYTCHCIARLMPLGACVCEVCPIASANSPLAHTVAASITYGCSLYHIQLQPLSHTVAASITYGCSLNHIRLQPSSHTVAGLRVRGVPHRLGEPHQQTRVEGEHLQGRQRERRHPAADNGAARVVHLADLARVRVRVRARVRVPLGLGLGLGLGSH